MRSLNRLALLRNAAYGCKRFYLTRIWQMDIDPTAKFSMSANFDRTYPKGVHVGQRSYVTLGVVVLTHDRSRGLYLHTRIGNDCFIGARSIIMPGVTVGDGSVVGAGSVVTRDVAPHSLVAGNPAKVLQEGIEVGAYGRFDYADENTHRLKATGQL